MLPISDAFIFMLRFPYFSQYLCKDAKRSADYSKRNATNYTDLVLYAIHVIRGEKMLRGRRIR